jgi:hypothetical protein
MVPMKYPVVREVFDEHDGLSLKEFLTGVLGRLVEQQLTSVTGSMQLGGNLITFQLDITGGNIPSLYLDRPLTYDRHKAD